MSGSADGWEQLSELILAQTQRDCQLVDEAMELKSSSSTAAADGEPHVDHSAFVVPSSPQTSDVWWVQRLKNITRNQCHYHATGRLQEPVSVLSACSAACSEAAVLHVPWLQRSPAESSSLW